MNKKYIIALSLSLSCGVHALARECYVFIGSYNFNRNKEGLFVYRMDTVTGTLTKVSATRGVPNPSYVSLSPDGKHLYACTETQTRGAGSVSGFDFDSRSGTLTFINSQSSGGENPVYLAVDKTGKWLVNADYTEGAVSVYPLSEPGTIQPPVRHIQYMDGGVSPRRQERAHVHCVLFSPSQDKVFFPDLGADKIRCYNFNAGQSQPLSATKDSIVVCSPGSGPRHMVFHPGGKYAYCTEEMAGYVSVYDYSDGRLVNIQRVAAHDKGKKSDFAMADVHLSPDGRFLYVTNRMGEDNIAIFAIDPVAGTLSLVGYESCGGNHPRSFAIDPSGNFLIVTNQVSGNVVVFKRDLFTGLLTRLDQRIKILNPSSVAIRMYDN